MQSSHLQPFHRKLGLIWLFGVASWFFLALSPQALALADTEIASSPVAIEAARAALDAADLTPAQRQSAQAQLESANSLDQDAAHLEEQLGALHDTLQPPPTVLAPLTSAERREQLEQWIARLPLQADIDTLERLLDEEHHTSASLKARIDNLSTELTELISRPGQTTERMSALRQQVDDSALELHAEDGEPIELLNVRRIRRAAEHRNALAKLALYEAEQRTLEIRQRQREAQLMALRREQALRAPRIDWLNQKIATESLQRLQAQANKHTALMAEVDPDDAQLSTLARTNADLAQQLVETTRTLLDERHTQSEYERLRDQIATALRDTQTRLRLGGGNAAIGHWLWQQYMAVPSLLALRAKRKEVQQHLILLRLDLYQNSEERYALTQDQPLFTREAIDAQSNEVTDARLASWKAAQVALLDQIDPLLRRRIAVLEQTDAALQALLAQGDELNALMSRQLLWVPSHSPIDASWPSLWHEQLQRIGAIPANLGCVTQALGDDLRADWPLYLILGGVFTGLLGLRLRAPRQLHAISQRMQNAADDHFAFTLQALLWTLLWALPTAVAVWGTGMALQDVAARAASDWLGALGQALAQLGELMLLTGLWRALVKPNALAEAHLGWPRQTTAVLQRFWPIAVAVLLPPSFFAILALHSNNDVTIGTVGRLSIMLMALGLALLAWKLLRSLISQSAHARSKGLRILSVLLPLAFIGVALLAVTGYLFTGIMVLDALLDSSTVILVVTVLHGLLHRWLLVSERHLARKRMQQNQHEITAVVDVEAGEVLPDSEPPELTLANIGAQSRRLLRILRMALLLLGLLWTWSDVLTALLRFDSLILWHSSATAADGSQTTLPVTLLNVLQGLLLLLLTFSMSRNLPGLLELLTSSSGLISNATRYTLTTLLRYAITIGGLLLAFGLFGLRWSQLQWMAAALTVGLGFGLQEIFANFVSGLILLVERPFRVGDTITIGTDLTGTVTRIRTRATTLLDYDNKEIVIPNKTFITGQFTNWTLSDSVTRLTLNVGVAYGSRPDQVRELLLLAASQHPGVLAEPVPNAWFMSLGDSTLDFELRVYVAALGDRLRVRHDLNRRITELLEEAGIEIAFPQMDLHLRDWPAKTPNPTPDPRGA